MDAIVIYESLTGNTERAARLVGGQLERHGVGTTVCPITAIDYEALARAELVVVGSWVDGIFVVGQRPAKLGRLRALPVISGKRCAAFLTYALDPGKALSKMEGVLADRGAEVLGGMTLHRSRIEAASVDFTERVLAATSA